MPFERSAFDSVRGLHLGRLKSDDLAAQFIDLVKNVDKTGYRLNSIMALAPKKEGQIFDSHSPLAGLPVVIKDNIEAIGLPCTAGSPILAKHTVTTDSQLVRRLRLAGANIIGSSNLSEWANIRSKSSSSGWSSVGGLTANPWIHNHSAGGSSSGSGAAVAAGLVALAVGTETNGSIISSASLNGCVGIKPTVGLIPTQGIVPISASQDSPGPMARSVLDAALLLEVMSSKSGYVSATQDTHFLRIGIVRSWLTGHDGTNALLDSSISKLSKTGIRLIEIELKTPDIDVGNDQQEVLLHELFDDLSTYLRTRTNSNIKSLADVVSFNLAHKNTELKYFGQDLFEKAILLRGRNEAYQAVRARNLAWAQKTLHQGFADVDVLIGATYPPAWISTLGKGDNNKSKSWITMAPSISGSPIATLPMGICEGLPVGIGVVAKKNHEPLLLTALAQIERSLNIGVLQPTFISSPPHEITTHKSEIK